MKKKYKTLVWKNNNLLHKKIAHSWSKTWLICSIVKNVILVYSIIQIKLEKWILLPNNSFTELSSLTRTYKIQLEKQKNKFHTISYLYWVGEYVRTTPWHSRLKNIVPKPKTHNSKNKSIASTRFLICTE